MMKPDINLIKELKKKTDRMENDLKNEKRKLNNEMAKIVPSPLSLDGIKFFNNSIEIDLIGNWDSTIKLTPYFQNQLEEMFGNGNFTIKISVNKTKKFGEDYYKPSGEILLCVVVTI